MALVPSLHSFAFGNRAELPFQAIHHAFEHHARTQPDANAVEHLGQSISYAVLDRRANRLAHRLRQHGVLPGARVCLLVQRSIAMIIGIVAVLKAGGQYVPLDAGIVTDSSLEHVLSDSSAVLTLVANDFAHRVTDKPHLRLEDVIEEDTANNTDYSKPPDLSSPRDGVYVIYTSGTTGKPKGVDVMHCNVVNLLCLAPGNVGMKPGLRVAQLLNIAFDMCAWEVLGSLANGCTLCLRGKTADEWKAVLRTVDVVIATPSVLGMYDPIDYPNIKFAATAGEVCPQSLADKWSVTGQFFNSCGPTEITIVNTVQPHVYGAKLSIGTPTPNNNVYVLDEHLNPCAVEEAGIMWAGGLGVTRGYINLPDKTAERYLRDPFANDGSVMFNTGDIGRWRADGQLEHLGRADDQVKVKGFRVELDGVAAAMEGCTAVKVACALLIGKELWGFYTPSTVPQADVKAATAKVQPYYAVPSKYIALPEFPHTSNGKIDKRALRALAEEKLASGSARLVPPAITPTTAQSPAPTPVPSPKPPSPTRPSYARGDSQSAQSAKPWSTLLHEFAHDTRPLQLQDCVCQPGPAQDQLHIVPVPIRLPRGSEPSSARVEVLSISSSVQNQSWWSKEDVVQMQTTHSEQPPAYNDITRHATCAILLVGGDAPSSMVSNCAACNGWGHASAVCPTPARGTIALEKIADVACALTQQSGVDVVCIVSDPKTSHAVVNELGHRGVAVISSVMA